MHPAYILSQNNHLFSSLYPSIPGKETWVQKMKEINLHRHGVLLYHVQDNKTLELTMVLSLTCALNSDRKCWLSVYLILHSPQDEIPSLQTSFFSCLKQGHKSDLLSLLPHGKPCECTWACREMNWVLRMALTAAVNSETVVLVTCVVFDTWLLAER